MKHIKGTVMGPTKLKDSAKAGDTVRAVGGTMEGKVVRVVQTGSLPYAVVDWGKSTGRHSITALEVVTARLELPELYKNTLKENEKRLNEIKAAARRKS